MMKKVICFLFAVAFVLVGCVRDSAEVLRYAVTIADTPGMTFEVTPAGALLGGAGVEQGVRVTVEVSADSWDYSFDGWEGAYPSDLLGVVVTGDRLTFVMPEGGVELSPTSTANIKYKVTLEEAPGVTFYVSPEAALAENGGVTAGTMVTVRYMDTTIDYTFDGWEGKYPADLKDYYPDPENHAVMFFMPERDVVFSPTSTAKPRYRVILNEVPGLKFSEISPAEAREDGIGVLPGTEVSVSVTEVDYDYVWNSWESKSMPAVEDLATGSDSPFLENDSRNDRFDYILTFIIPESDVVLSPTATAKAKYELGTVSSLVYKPSGFESYVHDFNVGAITRSPQGLQLEEVEYTVTAPDAIRGYEFIGWTFDVGAHEWPITDPAYVKHYELVSGELFSSKSKTLVFRLSGNGHKMYANYRFTHMPCPTGEVEVPLHDDVAGIAAEQLIDPTYFVGSYDYYVGGTHLFPGMGKYFGDRTSVIWSGSNIIDIDERGYGIFAPRARDYGCLFQFGYKFGTDGKVIPGCPEGRCDAVRNPDGLISKINDPPAANVRSNINTTPSSNSPSVLLTEWPKEDDPCPLGWRLPEVYEALAMVWESYYGHVTPFVSVDMVGTGWGYNDGIRVTVQPQPGITDGGVLLFPLSGCRAREVQTHGVDWGEGVYGQYCTRDKAMVSDIDYQLQTNGRYVYSFSLEASNTNHTIHGGTSDRYYFVNNYVVEHPVYYARAARCVRNIEKEYDYSVPANY